MKKIKNLEELRIEIDSIDQAIIDLIAKRLDLAKEIGEVKRKIGYGVVDLKREEAVLESRDTLAQEKGIKKGIVRKIYKLLINEARRVQQ